MPEKIVVFGDSHSTFFFPAPFFVGRVGLKFPLKFVIKGEAIHAASIMGFRPGVSTLNTKEKILGALSDADRMILAFGQVDLELGFYYRLFIKKEKFSPEEFCSLLIGVYRQFLEGVAGRVDLAIKGVNLTALSPRPFAARYIARIIVENSKISLESAEKSILEQVLNEDAQNDMHLLFNELLRDMCADTNIKYFDLVKDTSSGGLVGVTAQKPRLAEEHKTARFDHHLADTIAVRKMHYIAAGNVFNLC